jgi:hypothetical protein
VRLVGPARAPSAAMRAFYRPTRPATGAEDIEPGRSGEQRGADHWRPQHVPAGGKAPIPAVDYSLRLGARGPVGLLMSSPRVRTPIAPVSGRGPQKSIRRSEGRWHRTAGPAPPANSTPVVAVVTWGQL